ncbi:MAG: hypothetical protein WC382_03390 [Methanoregulaceae archaeon]
MKEGFRRAGRWQLHGRDTGTCRAVCRGAIGAAGGLFIVQCSRFPPVWHFSRATVSAGLTRQDDRVRQWTNPGRAPSRRRTHPS